MKEIFLRVNQYLLFFVLLVVILYFGKTFLIPIVFAAMLAMLMAPVCRKLDKIGFHRAVSSLVCILILAGVVVGMVAIISAQFAAFSKDVETIKKKVTELKAKTQSYIEERFDLAPKEQEKIVKEEAKKMQGSSSDKKGSMPARIAAGVISALGGIILTLVFTFLFIFNKERYQEFFLRLYKNEDEDRVRKIVDDIRHVSQSYLTGKAMSITIIAILYSIGLSIVGIKNAILLAGIAALLTVIPYVGTVLGGLFPVMMALVTEDSVQPALWAAVVMFAIQTIDNYFIEPNVVGGEVNLSALFSILSIIAGGMIWGIPGMILFLPLFGIIKIICDHVEALKPIGFVIGDPRGKKSSKVSTWFKEKIGLMKKRKS
jgi:predicted PurR-regulated permease PerM